MSADDTAEFVRTARAKLNLTQSKLGELVGRDRRSIIRYEQGEELPPGLRLAIMHLLSTMLKIKETAPPPRKKETAPSPPRKKKESRHAKAVRHRRRS